MSTGRRIAVDAFGVRKLGQKAKAARPSVNDRATKAKRTRLELATSAVTGLRSNQTELPLHPQLRCRRCGGIVLTDTCLGKPFFYFFGWRVRFQAARAFLFALAEAGEVWYGEGMPQEENTTFIYYGSDEGAAAAGAAARYAELTAGDENGWGNEIIDGAVGTADEAVGCLGRVVEALQTVSMFGGKKVIWLKGANFMGDTPSGARSEAVQGALDDLVKVVQNMPAETYLVVSAAEVDKRRSFFKKLAAAADMQESSLIDISREGWESEVAALTLRLAKQRDLRFDNAAMDLFVQRVNEGSRQIANELDKLDVYLGSERRTVQEADVELMVPVSRHGVIFEISRALERQDSRTAVRLVNEQLAQGEQAVTIMRAAIVPTVRNRYCARLLVDTYNLNPAAGYRGFESALNKLSREAQKALPRKKDGSISCYGIFQAARSLRKLTLAKARQHLFACAQADRQLVSTQLDPRDVLHKLIVTLTAV